MDTDRLLLNIRTIDVSYRSALRHAPESGAAPHAWRDGARVRAEQMLNALESRARGAGPLDARVALQLRVVRERIRRPEQLAPGRDAGGGDGDGDVP